MLAAWIQASSRGFLGCTIAAFDIDLGTLHGITGALRGLWSRRHRLHLLRAHGQPKQVCCTGPDGRPEFICFADVKHTVP